ncbi:MAG: hypothetical protein ACI4GO_03200 [Hominenteromicrobium sp.]
MINKWFRPVAFAAALVLAAASFAGCASGGESSASEVPVSSEATATPEPTATPSPEPEEKLAVIGTESDKETVFAVVLENGTKQDITGIAVKDSSLEEFPENMLEDEDVFAAGEKRTLYYDSESAVKAAEEEQDGSDKLLEPQYDIRITLEDGTVLVLHAFPFGDLEEGKILVEEDIAYLEYTSAESGQKVSTKEAELAVKEAEEAAAQSDAGNQSWTETPASDSGSVSNDQPAYVPQPEPETPAGSDNGGQEGCLDDALFN